MKNIMLIILIFFSMLPVRAFDDTTSVNKVIEIAVEKTGFNFIYEEADSFSFSAGFDFLLLQPAFEKKDTGVFYQAYYLNGRVKRVKIIDTAYNQVNYDFGIFREGSFTLLTAYRYNPDKDSSKTGFNIYGFFLVDRTAGKILFFGPLYYDTSENIEHAITQIRTIFQVDNHLLPKGKLMFLYNSLVYQTRMVYEDNKIKEKIWHYLFHPDIPSNGCNKYKDLSVLQLADLYKLFKKPGLCPSNLLGDVEPREKYFTNKIPFLWDFHEYFHK